MSKGIIEIPVSVLSSVETLDELQDWLTAQNSQIIDELREARRQDLAGEFKAWEPRHVSWLPRRSRPASRRSTKRTGSRCRPTDCTQDHLAGANRCGHD